MFLAGHQTSNKLLRDRADNMRSLHVNKEYEKIRISNRRNHKKCRMVVESRLEQNSICERYSIYGRNVSEGTRFMIRSRP